MKLLDIIKANAEFVRKSNYTVNVNRSLGWVDITPVGGSQSIDDTFFFQGDEAHQFIDEADKLFDNPALSGELSRSDILFHCARPYVEFL